MLTGKAKTDYQREYMRKRRLNPKNAVSAILGQKPALENAPDLSRSDELQPVRPNLPPEIEAKVIAGKTVPFNAEKPWYNPEPCPRGVDQNRWNYICQKRATG